MIEEPDMNQHYEACLRAVQIHFNHLTLEEIRQPPRGYLDAFLARQIALHILIDQFGWPKRRVGEELGRNRGCVRVAVYSVNARLRRAEEFKTAYQYMTELAYEELKNPSAFLISEPARQRA